MYLQDARHDADSRDGDLGAAQREERRVNHHGCRRAHRLIIVQRLAHALRNTFTTSSLDLSWLPYIEIDETFNIRPVQWLKCPNTLCCNVRAEDYA